MRKKLPPWLDKIDRFVDAAIPYLLVLLAVLIILEFSDIAKDYHDTIIKIDYLIIAFFVVDLCFKWHHTRNVSKFIKLYWIDIIAVFPFYTLFRVYYIAAELLTAGEQTQKILHEAVLLREAKVLREAESAARFAKQGRLVRLLARGLRVLRARLYITHWHLLKISRTYKGHR